MASDLGIWSPSLTSLASVLVVMTQGLGTGNSTRDSGAPLSGCVLIGQLSVLGRGAQMRFPEAVSPLEVQVVCLQSGADCMWVTGGCPVCVTGRVTTRLCRWLEKMQRKGPLLTDGTVCFSGCACRYG